MTSEFYDNLRMVNVSILGLAFIVMIYKGVFKLTTVKGSFDWDRFTNLCWTMLSIFGIGEILYQHLEGGYRVFLTLVVSLLQLYVAVFKYSPKAEIPCKDLRE